MGTLNRIAITGAAGYLGRTAVAEARARGLSVTAILRGGAPMGWAADDGIAVARHDLSRAAPEALADSLRGAGAVLHLAGHMGADVGAHARDTLAATEALLSALAPAGVNRLVLASSLSVYVPPPLSGGPHVIDEATPLAAAAETGDAYASAKICQEALCRAATGAGLDLWLMRVGAVWGPGRTWNAHLGHALGPLLLRLGDTGELPLAHVGTAAAALLDAAAADPGGIRAVNVVDADRPDRDRFLAAHRAGGWPKRVLRLPLPLAAGAARIASPVSHRLPGLLRSPVLARRMAPACYPDAGLAAAFGPRAQDSFEARMARALEGAA